MVIPRLLREAAGVTEGTLMKVAVIDGGQFLVTPQFTINRSLFAKVQKNNEPPFRELAQVVSELRKEAKEKGLDTMSKKEINRAMAAARRDMKKTINKPAK